MGISFLSAISSPLSYKAEKNISLNRDDERINIAFLENANGKLFCILKQKGLKI